MALALLKTPRGLGTTSGLPTGKTFPRYHAPRRHLAPRPHNIYAESRNGSTSGVAPQAVAPSPEKYPIEPEPSPVLSPPPTTAPVAVPPRKPKAVKRPTPAAAARPQLIAAPMVTQPSEPPLRMGCPTTNRVGRALIGAFALVLMYGGVLTSIANGHPMSAYGALFVSGFVYLSSIGALAKTSVLGSIELLSGALGFLTFNALSQLLTSAPRPLFAIPPYLMLCFTCAIAAVFLLPPLSRSPASVSGY